MKIRTFKSRSRPVRRSLGVIPAPEVFGIRERMEGREEKEKLVNGKKKEEPEIESLSPQDKEVDSREKREEYRLDSSPERGKGVRKRMDCKQAKTDAINRVEEVDRAEIKPDKTEIEFDKKNDEDRAEIEPEISGKVYDLESGLNRDRRKEGAQIVFAPIETEEKEETEERLDISYISAEKRQWSSFSCVPVRNMKKVGESTFSEIFIDRTTMVVYKIVPLTKEKVYKRVQHTKIDHFIKECLIMEKMNRSRYSTKIYRWHLINRSYPEDLLNESKRWLKNNSEVAENIIPQKNNSSGLFGVIVMEYGGCELEKVNWKKVSKSEVFSILNEIEKCINDMDRLSVEHRDLHESNVLVDRTEDGGFKVKIIDYSLSQAVLSAGSDESSVEIVNMERDSVVYKVGSVLYTDIDKEIPWLLKEVDDQPHRKVYEMMDRAYLGRNRWRRTGRSNEFWKNYLISWIKKKIEE